MEPSANSKKKKILIGALKLLGGMACAFLCGALFAYFAEYIFVAIIFIPGLIWFAIEAFRNSGRY